MSRDTIQTRCMAVAAAALVAAPAGGWARTEEESTPVDGYAAMVNNHVILQSDVDMAAGPHVRNLARTFEARMREMQLLQEDPPSEEEQREMMREFNEMTREARSQALDSLIERFLIVDEFKRQEGELPERMVQDQIQRIVEDRFEGNRSMLEDSLSQFQMTYEEFKEQTREDLIANLLRHQEVGKLPSVSPKEVLAFYESRLEERYRQPEAVRLSGIALAQGETDEEKAAKRGLAEELRGQLLDGADFATLAREKSDGRNAEEGGDWGWRPLDDWLPELRRAIEQTPVGQISEIIETETDQGGWYYLLWVDARKEATVIPFEQVRDDLREELEEMKSQETYRAWIERLKKHHYLKVF